MQKSKNLLGWKIRKTGRLIQENKGGNTDASVSLAENKGLMADGFFCVHVV